jgi:hypothetical protein
MTYPGVMLVVDVDGLKLLRPQQLMDSDPRNPQQPRCKRYRDPDESVSLRSGFGLLNHRNPIVDVECFRHWLFTLNSSRG